MPPDGAIGQPSSAPSQHVTVELPQALSHGRPRTPEPADRCYNILVAIQLRDYRIRAGELERFVEEWRSRLAPLRRAQGFEIPGAWTVPDENRFVWLLAHDGGWDEFAAADAAYFASPARAALDPDPVRLIEEQRNVRLSEVDPG